MGMCKGNSGALMPRARRLRHDMTKEERRLWYGFLRLHPAHVYRQRVIGHYIVDFYCAEAKLVIELDGSQHYEPKEQAYDAARTEYLESVGLHVVRIPNNAVNQNFSGVCEYLSTLLPKLPLESEAD